MALRPLDAVRVPPGAGSEKPAGASDSVALHASGARIAAEAEPIHDAPVRILDNACRHAPSGTPLTVHSRAEPADPDEGADACDRIAITIADRDPGMSRTHVRRALDPFRRAPDKERAQHRDRGRTPAARRVIRRLRRDARHRGRAPREPAAGRCRAPRYGQRWSIGLTSRRVAPTNSWRGRPIFCSGSEIISFHCAIQPTVRASAKMQVNIDVGMPSAFCTMPE